MLTSRGVLFELTNSTNQKGGKKDDVTLEEN